jgi:hypothetical protein
MRKMRNRAMRPGDVPECVDIIANHPVLGPRYGRDIDLLCDVWLRLLSSEAQVTTVLFPNESSDAPVCLFGWAVFVRDEFLREIKNMPQFWVGPDLVRRLSRSESPILTDSELLEANSRGGLNLLVWEGCIAKGYENDGELQRRMMEGFIERHRGYFLKEVIATQCEDAERLAFTLKTGGALWDPTAGRYAEPGEISKKSLSEIASHPHLVGLTREMELNRQNDWGASWVGALFDYHPPKLALSRGEQRLLSSALSGATDEHLAAMLGISLSAVKKHWVSIYLRVDDHLSGLTADPGRSHLPAGSRGKEKRRRLLEYLRKHPEELRPVSRKLLASRMMNSNPG